MKKIISIILIAVLCSAVFIVAKNVSFNIMLKDANYGMNYLKKQGNCDNLFVGSSMFRQGIDTEKISDENSSSYLLSYNGNQPYSIYYEVEELIKNNVKIKNLLVDMYAYSLTANVTLSDERIFQGNSPKFALSIFNAMKENGTGKFGDLYEMIVKSNNEFFITSPVSFPLINKRYIHGSNNNYTAGSDFEKLQKLPIDFGEREVNSVQLEYLSKLIDLCNKNNINVIFIETPKYSRLYEEDKYCGIMSEYIIFLNKFNVKQYLSEKTAKNCNIDLSENHTIYIFDSDNSFLFTDLIHMSSEGRAVFSDMLKTFLVEKNRFDVLIET